jgi:AraC-like DNA-binding protein
MAGRANSLTKDATPSIRAAAPPVWTISALDVRVLVSGLERLGYDGASLLSASGLTEADLTNPDARLSCEVHGKVLSHAMRTRYLPNISLKLAQVTPLGAYALLDYLVLTSDTVGAGLRQLAQYFRLTGSPVSISLRETARSARVELTSVPDAPGAVEYVAALMILHMLRETDGRFGASEVSFRHSPDDSAEFERVLGCPIRTNAAWSGVTVTADVFRRPLSRRDSVLRQLLEVQAKEMLARVPARNGLAADVQRVLSSRMTGGDVRIEAVARALATSARTLQRRLSAEGASYQDLLDDLRKEAAGRHLTESVFAIGEVAYLVGYSEPAPFYRAFKRWYGVTPEAFRHARRRS